MEIRIKYVYNFLNKQNELSPDRLDPYQVKQWASTFVNYSTFLHIHATMQCNDRTDLLDMNLRNGSYPFLENLQKNMNVILEKYFNCICEFPDPRSGTGLIIHPKNKEQYADFYVPCNNDAYIS